MSLSYGRVPFIYLSYLLNISEVKSLEPFHKKAASFPPHLFETAGYRVWYTHSHRGGREGAGDPGAVKKQERAL